MRLTKEQIGILGVFLLLVFIAFGRSLTQSFAPIDDSFLVVNNLAIRGITLENLKTIFTSYDPELYIPLTFLSFQINFMIGVLDPMNYHLTNLLLHAANALLVTWLLTVLTEKKRLALIAGLIFAVHPLNSEAVVWIAGRKDLLSTFFVLLSFIYYIKRAQGLSVLFFLLALLSKVNVMTLPAIIILYDVLIANRRFDLKLIREKLPYIALSTLFLVIALVGKERILSSSSPLDTIFMAAKSSTFYLQKFFLPTNLSVFYPYQGEISLFSTDFLPHVLIVIGLIALAFKKRGWFAFGTLFYFVTLSPTFLNFMKGDSMFFAVDRYAYLPVIGVLFLFIKFCEQKQFASIGKISGVVVISVLCMLSFKQTTLWDTPETLFSHSLLLYPESVVARTDLSRIHRDAGKYEEAFAVLKEGLPYGDHLSMRLGAGYIYARTGQVYDALEQFEVARDMKPTHPEPHFALGSLKEQIGLLDEARGHYENAVALDASYVIARTRLGNMYFDAGERNKAQEQFAIALDWNESSLEAHIGIAKVLMEENQFDEAYAHLQKAHSLNSYSLEVLVPFARVEIERENVDRAQELLEKALRIEEYNPEVRALMEKLKVR